MKVPLCASRPPVSDVGNGDVAPDGYGLQTMSAAGPDQLPSLAPLTITGSTSRAAVACAWTVAAGAIAVMMNALTMKMRCRMFVGPFVEVGAAPRRRLHRIVLVPAFTARDKARRRRRR